MSVIGAGLTCSLRPCASEFGLPVFLVCKWAATRHANTFDPAFSADLDYAVLLSTVSGYEMLDHQVSPALAKLVYQMRRLSVLSRLESGLSDRRRSLASWGNDNSYSPACPDGAPPTGLACHQNSLKPFTECVQALGTGAAIETAELTQHQGQSHSLA